MEIDKGEPGPPRILRDLRKHRYHQDQPAPAEPSSPPAETNERAARLNELSAGLDSISSELRNVYEQENRLVNEINEKTGRRFSYNLIQIKQLEKELEPLRAELADVRQRRRS